MADSSKTHWEGHDMAMNLAAAVSFATTHARVLERRLLHLLLGKGSPGEVLAALDAYRNPDGGYGWALEPDLRSATSQPVAAMHALEVLADIRDTGSRRPVELCDWLAGRTLPDGGLPLALPYADTAGSAPLWATADATVSTLQMTAQTAAQAHRLARHRVDVAGHPWLAPRRPTAWMRSIGWWRHRPYTSCCSRCVFSTRRPNASLAPARCWTGSLATCSAADRPR
jgi:hypothetical protein